MKHDGYTYYHESDGVKLYCSEDLPSTEAEFYVKYSLYRYGGNLLQITALMDDGAETITLGNILRLFPMVDHFKRQRKGVPIGTPWNAPIIKEAYERRNEFTLGSTDE